MNIERIKRLANAYLLALANEPQGLPSGHLYALLAMPAGGSLDEHNAAVAAIKRAGLVAESHFLLTWTGPEDVRQKLVQALKADETERSAR